MSQHKRVYCVVYLVDANKHVIILFNWMKDVIEANFLNHGVNSNQPVLVYYSNDFDSPVNHHLPVSTQIDETTVEGCYRARPKKCFSMYLILIR